MTRAPYPPLRIEDYATARVNRAQPNRGIDKPWEIYDAVKRAPEVGVRNDWAAEHARRRKGLDDGAASEGDQ